MYKPVVYKIRNKAHAKGLPHLSPDHLWWHNGNDPENEGFGGWGARSTASRFTHREMQAGGLPVDGEWYRAEFDR